MYVLTVEQATAYLKDLIEEDPILSDVWVRGEVTSFFRSAAGHCYFTLTGEDSQLKCVLFRNSQRGLLLLPKAGDAIVAHGAMSIYESQGAYQLYVDNIAPEGVGLLQLQFEELRKRLDAEGLFNVERKRPLPLFPRSIGVVTSAQGAVWHDIQNVISRRYPIAELILSSSTVQGPDAPRELIAGLEALQEDGRSDLIILARGGGSPEDLAAFNDENLARAIYASKVPVVSAVGHETDVSISDLVADVRAPTPSAAAELTVPHQDELRALLWRAVTAAHDHTHQRLGSSRDELMFKNLYLTRLSPQPHINRLRLDIDLKTQHAQLLSTQLLQKLRQRIAMLNQGAELLNPNSVLERGYAAISSPDTGSRIRTAKEAREAGRVRLQFRDGDTEAQIAKET